MYIALASVSSDLAVREALRFIAPAIEAQLYQDYAPLWDSDGCAVIAFDSLDKIPRDAEAFPLIVFDDADQEGTLGWHSSDVYGRGHGRAFWNVLKDNGGTLTKGPLSLSVTLSHEALEMVGDPYVNFWADTEEPGEQEALELADRCQADAYERQGIALSNCLGPRAFREGTGPYDLLRLLHSPWEIRPGGYAIRRKGAEVFPVWGAGFPDWLKQTKLREGSRTMQRVQR